jgi:glucuronoarabinoxylan endo-1,4-beta-xylanase
MREFFILAFALVGQLCYAQSATIDWSGVHQVIDGFGASVGLASATPAMEHFWFDNTPGNLGLSILRVAVPDNSAYPGDCSSVGSGCIGSPGYASYVSAMQVAAADGARIYATPWTPPPAYKTNGQGSCTGGIGNGTLAPASYGAYATWLANFVQSLQNNGLSVYAMSVQNEPDYCASYEQAIMSSSTIDTFIKNNLGPTFSSRGISTLIFMPEVANYSHLTSYGATCAMDSSCASYVGGVNWHDYDATLTYGTFVPANSAAYPAGWPAKKYWQTEAGCITGAGPNLCESGFTTDMAVDGLLWAALLDDRMAVRNANGYLYWGLWSTSANNGGLEYCTGGSCTVAQRAYVFGQYARFVRPGYYRIDATHIPQVAISMSAYQNASTGQLVIVATNYGPSPVTQSFRIINAPMFTSMTPYVTAATQQIQEQSAQPVTSNSFTYVLPAESVTTFVGVSPPTAAPGPPTNLQATVK